MNSPFKKSIFKMAIISISSLYAINLEAASFDCKKASTDIEKLICSNETTSQYDEELGQYYKEALLKYPDRKEMLVRQQRNWIKWIRNSCSDPSCLATLYRARAGEVRRAVDVPGLDGTEKPNFIVVEGNGDSLCDEYVNILNRTPRNELKACKLPDLTGSSIRPVEFKPLTGDALKAMDKIVYEQGGGGPHLDWEQKWPEREKEYASGYRKLSEAYWDLDKDGEKDQLVSESFPYVGCVMLGPGEPRAVSKAMERDWEILPKKSQQLLAEENGFVNFYKAIKDGKLSFVSASNFVSYENENISIDHRMLTDINTDDIWADKTWVEIWTVDHKRDDKYREYGMGTSLCKFWFSN